MSHPDWAAKEGQGARYTLHFVGPMEEGGVIASRRARLGVGGGTRIHIRDARSVRSHTVKYYTPFFFLLSQMNGRRHRRQVLRCVVLCDIVQGFLCVF